MPYGVLLYLQRIALDRKENMNDVPNFAAWSMENLADFASQAYRKMQEQNDRIEQLQADYKDAVEHYHKLITGKENE